MRGGYGAARGTGGVPGEDRGGTEKGSETEEDEEGVNGDGGGVAIGERGGDPPGELAGDQNGEEPAEPGGGEAGGEEAGEGGGD